MARESKEPAAPPPPLSPPNFRIERRAMRNGAEVVAGVDEAGRGPLAGPVVVSAVILDPRRIPKGIDDSKKLTADAREELAAEILRKAAAVSVAAAPPTIIARLNILWATMWAMRESVRRLAIVPDHVLIDGNLLPRELPCVGQAVVDGDARCLSIAAASIVAKVTRDRMCQIMHCDEPRFGFDSHKGYSTPEHFNALFAHGPGRHHRSDFAPVIAARERQTGVLILTP
jgi:ribonuclease HII